MDCFQIFAAVFFDDIDDIGIGRSQRCQEGQIAARCRELGDFVIIRQEVDQRQDGVHVHFKDVDRASDVVIVDGFGMEFAEVAEDFAVFDIASSLPRMERCPVRNFQVSLDAQSLEDGFDEALDVIEIVVFHFCRPFSCRALAIEEACDVEFLFRQFRQGQLFRAIDRGDFIDADRRILDGLVADQDIHQRRDERRPHEREVFRNRVEDRYGIVYGVTVFEEELLQLVRMHEAEGDRFVEAAAAEDGRNLFAYIVMEAGFPFGDRRCRARRRDIFVAVDAGYFFGDIRHFRAVAAIAGDDSS